MNALYGSSLPWLGNCAVEFSYWKLWYPVMSEGTS